MSPSNLEILAYETTPLGILCLRRRQLLSDPGTVVTEVTLNHEFLMSSHHTASEQALASVALDMFAGDTVQALVGGLGLGYTASAVLADERVAQVEVIELLPQVVDWLKQGLFPLADELRNDKRFLTTQDDVYARLLQEPTRQFDLIIIDVDHSPDDRLATTENPFYTEDGLRHARKHLSKDGILGVWSYARSSPFADALHAVFENVRVEPVTFDNEHSNETVTDWLFFARNS